MSVPAAIVSLLGASPTFTDVFGTRIYPGILPYNPELPAVRYNKVAGSGGTTTGPDLVMTRIQFDVYADTAVGAEAGAKALYDVLRRYSGTVGGMAISDVQLDYMQTILEPVTDSYRAIMDFKVWTEGM